MRKKGVDLYLGLFVLAGLVAIGFMILRFGGWSTRNTYEVTVLFNDVGDLIEGASVKYRGLPCGSVKRMTITEVKSETGIPVPKVKVVLAINQEWTLREQDGVEIVPVGWLGDMIVRIVPGPPEATPLSKKGTAVVWGADPTGVPEQIREWVGPLPEIMKNLEELTGEDGPLVGAANGMTLIVNDIVPAVLNDMRNGVMTLTSQGESFLRENRGQISKVIKTMDQTLISSRDLVDNLKRLTGEKGSLTETVEELRGGLGDIRRLAHALYPTVKKLQEGQGGLGGFIHDPTWYEDFSKLLLALRKSKFLHLDEEYEKEQRLVKRRARGPTVWVR